MKFRSLVEAALLDQERRILLASPVSLRVAGGRRGRVPTRPPAATAPPPAPAEPKGTLPAWDGRKRSLSFPPLMLAEMRAAAVQQNLPLSRLLRHAWEAARERIMQLPAAPP